MNADEKLKSAGFGKQNEDGGDCCLFCNYYHLSSDKTKAKCMLHEVRFWDEFEASEYVCRRFDGGMLDSLFSEIAKESSGSAIPSNQKQVSQSSLKEGCYIATAVYGDYNAPEVLLLRMFRDGVLKKSKLGRLFIKIYYAISPTLAHKLKNHPFVNSKIKIILDHIVRQISNKFEWKY